MLILWPFRDFSHHYFILDFGASFIMTKKDKKKGKKKSQSSIPGSRISERDRKQRIIPQPPGADLSITQQMEMREKKRQAEIQARYRRKKNPDLKPRGPNKKKPPLKKKSATSSPSNPMSQAFKNNQKQANKVKNEKIMNDINRLRNVPRSPHSKHSKAPLMRIVDIFNQPNWQETIKQLNDTVSPTKQLNTVVPEVKRVNLEDMMKDHHPTKILHKI